MSDLSKFLLIDDEIIQLEGLRHILLSARPGAAVFIARDGKQALIQIDKILPDSGLVIFCDIRMPGMDGLTFLAELRRREIHAPVVIISAYPDFEYAKQAMQYGALDYLLKPYKPEDIAQVMANISRAFIPPGESRDKNKETLKQEDGLISDCLFWMKSNLDKNYSLQETAERFYFNPNYFSYLIKRRTGTSYSKYMMRLRMNRARELLTDTGLQVQEVAVQTGYRDPSYFNRVFRQENGIAPDQYRRLNRRKNVK